MRQRQTPSGLIHIEAETGKTIRDNRKGECHGSFTVKPDDIANYEEIDLADVPPYTEEQYDAKVAELIHQRYSPDKETALINNKLADTDSDTDTDAAAAHRAEYAAYQAYRADCKRLAKQLLTENPSGAEE